MRMNLGIIGGGPAGLSAALTAARRGMKVTLFESKQVGENINCAEGFFDMMKLLDKPAYGRRVKVQKLLIETDRLHKVSTDGLNLWII